MVVRDHALLDHVEADQVATLYLHGVGGDVELVCSRLRDVVAVLTQDIEVCDVSLTLTECLKSR